MINPLNYILLFFVSIMISGCVQGVKTEVIQKEEFSYLKFTGDTELISVIIDDGAYNFNLQLYTYIHYQLSTRIIYSFHQITYCFQVLL